MPAIYHEGSWLGNATDPEVFVKDTVGWTGKNRAYSQTNNAVIAHIENGITYDVSWTGSATVTLKKNSASGATITSGSTSPLSFTADADYELYFGSSATVTNIMVKDSRITDPTYEPYHESVEVMYEEEIHGVNLLKPYVHTILGITYTPNADGYFTASSANDNRTWNYFNSNLKFILSPGSYILASYVKTAATGSGIGVRIFDAANNEIIRKALTTESKEVQFTIAQKTELGLMFKIGEGSYAFSIRKADIDDPTYRPYNYQAIQNQLNAQGVLGAKNLNKYPYTDTTKTSNGVTFTDNGDGTITANGTATELAVFNCHTRGVNENIFPNGKYILTGCPANGSTNTYYLNAWRTYNGISNNLGRDIGDGVNLTLAGDDYSTNNVNLQIQIMIKSGTTVNNLTFKPMLRLASDPDDTYQPYAMNNRELTEKKINIADLKTVVSASSDFADFKTRIASL